MTPAMRRAFGTTRRTPITPGGLEIEQVSATFRAPGSSYTLRPLQVRALYEAWQVGGLFGALGLGQGKTAITLLLPEVWGCELAALFVPAAMIGQTLTDFDTLRRHLKTTCELRVLSYNALSSSPGLLDGLAREGCTAVVCDEAHALSDTNSGRTRRMLRFLGEHPAMHFAALSATFTSASVHDYAHLLAAALPEPPLPVEHYPDLEYIARAIDRSHQSPCGPGCLEGMPGWDADETRRDAARMVIARRLADTPGVVVSFETSTDAPLTVRAVPYDLPPGVEAALETLAQTWTTPAGFEVQDAMSVRQAHLQAAMGFAYVPRVPPPVSWRLAARGWVQASRYAISELRRELDTEGDVVRALGELPDWIGAARAAWERERDAFKLELEPRLLEPDGSWFVAALVDQWLHAHPRGLVWVGYTFVGQELSRRLGVPFYSQLARDASKRHASKHPPHLPAILSIGSCARGLNLQAHTDNLYLCAPTDQSIGRTHRAGQRAGVLVEVAVATEVQRKALESAQEGARYASLSVGTVSAFADVDVDFTRL